MASSRSATDTVEAVWDGDVLLTCRRRVSSNSVKCFLGELGELIGARGVMQVFPSARTALTHLLKSLPTGVRREVLMCGFNCPVVASAVAAAGMKPVFFDLANPWGGVDWDGVSRLVGESHAALIVTHFFGVPEDFSPVMQVCRQHGVFVVEDCAHTLDGRVGGVAVGNFGDAAVFSFNFDKPLTLGWGGALLINNETLICRSPQSVAPTVSVDDEYSAMKRHLRRLAVRRCLVGRLDEGWITRCLGRLGVIRMQPLSLGIGLLRAELGRWQIARYHETKARRNRNAEVIARSAFSYRGWPVGEGAEPAWLRQRVITRSPEEGAIAAGVARRNGMRSGNFNWAQPALAGIDALVPNAALAWSYGIDVPVHQGLSELEMEWLSGQFNRA